MSALLSVSGHTLRYAESILSRCSAAHFHTSPPVLRPKKPVYGASSRPPGTHSRTRLVKDIKPTGGKGQYDTVQREKKRQDTPARTFEREGAPHTGRVPRESFQPGSSRPRPSEARRSERRPARREGNKRPDFGAPRDGDSKPWDGRKPGSGAKRLPVDVLKTRDASRDSRERWRKEDAPPARVSSKPWGSWQTDKPAVSPALSLSSAGPQGDYFKPPPVPEILPTGKRYRAERPHLARNPDVLDHSLETRRSKTMEEMSDSDYNRFDKGLPKPSPKGSSNLYDKPATGKELFEKDRAGRSPSAKDERIAADLSRDRHVFAKKETLERKPAAKPVAYNPLGDEFFVPQPRGSEFKGPSTHGKKTRDGQPTFSAKNSSPYDAIAPASTELSDSFNTPPLIPGLLQGVHEVLGINARPSDIQSLSMKWLFGKGKPAGDGTLPTATLDVDPAPWQQFLLAAETGSGKSIAYFLPLLQSLKVSELSPKHQALMPQNRAFNPRAIVLSPTHELSRQLASFGKALTHECKLKIVCASKANVPSTRKMEGTASKMRSANSQVFDDAWDVEGTGVASSKAKGIDVLVGTPMKMLEMVRGRGWDAEERQAAERASRKVEDDWDVDENGRKIKKPPPRWIRKGAPEIGLEGIEWVVVDEADVLFDPDFQESTRMLLADISAARGKPVGFEAKSVLDTPSEETDALPSPANLDYPFHLLLTSATIPSSLAAYLDAHHPNLTRLASRHLHHLPKALQTEYVAWTGGNKNADVERRLRRVWSEDSQGIGYGQGGRGEGGRSKILIFCNKSNKVDELGRYLEEKGIKNVALTSTSGARKRGSNHHLDGFVRQPTNVNPAKSQIGSAPPAPAAASAAAADEEEGIPDFYMDMTNPSKATDSNPATIVVDEKIPLSTKFAPTVAEDPYVMITTSLLSRGLDFAPDVRHVFIVDEPRNMIDFLHRAGRSGRAGESGKVVVFGKMKGRGSERVKTMRKKVGALLG